MIEKNKKYNIDLKINKEYIDDFLREYDIWYSNNKEDIVEKFNNDIKLHKEFLSLFPKEKIKEMNIDGRVKSRCVKKIAIGITPVAFLNLFFPNSTS